MFSHQTYFRVDKNVNVFYLQGFKSYALEWNYLYENVEDYKMMSLR